MMEKRRIREEEILLIKHLLSLKHLKEEEFPISEDISDYEGAIMGSIGLGRDTAVYLEDLIQVKYIDVDGIPVVITLTVDTEKRLLDLDFWKEDFTKLIQYPTGNSVEIMS